MWARLVVLFAVLSILATSTNARPLTDAAKALQITSLPGLTFMPAFDQYSGYITVDASAGRALFFYFAEATAGSDNDLPLMLWQTGGPGCSSLLAWGLENGPFQPTETGGLEMNPYAWNQFSNAIWVESPRNVGFSYSNTSSDNNVGDNATAADILVFLEEFVKIFPQYAGRELWLTGESYGGHYVPNTAYWILQQSSFPLKLVGFAVGNAWTDTLFDNSGCVNYWSGHALCSNKMSSQILANCNLSSFGPLKTEQSKRVIERDVAEQAFAAPGPSTECVDALMTAYAAFGNISIYDIIVDVGCFWSPVGRSFVEQHPLYRHMAAMDVHSARHTRAYDSCGEEELTAYLNRADVQEAMHATRDGATVVWNECSNTLNYSYTDLLRSMLPTYWYLLNESSISINVYSGDLDAIVPFTGSESWIASLGRKVTAPWRPWYDDQQQVGGRVTIFDRMTFATVRGAGHEVPMYMPGRAYVLLSSIFRGVPLPN